MTLNRIATSTTAGYLAQSPALHELQQIQAHGLLLILHPSSLTVLQVSLNTVAALALPPQAMLGRTLESLLDRAQVDQLKHWLIDDHRLDQMNPVKLRFPKGDGDYSEFDAVFHRSADGFLVLELEPGASYDTIPFLKFYHLAQTSIHQLEASASLPDLFQVVVQEVCRVTGFDRVMLYRFDHDGHGEVVAEKKQPEMEAYLGLHYPESDIPRSARQIFLSNSIRVIRDAAAPAVDLYPRQNPITHQPTDLTRSILRSADPCHLQYLHNMGVSASLTISLIRDGQLWGLIACHHRTPKYVPYELRKVCEFLGRMIFAEISIRADAIDHQDGTRLAQAQSALVQAMAATDCFVEGLVNQDANLINLVNAQGAAIYFGDRWTTLGQTPPETMLAQLVNWLAETVTDEVFYTDTLPGIYAEAKPFKATSSGLLAIPISKTSFVLWFRPEVLQTVTWGGDPHHAYEIQEISDKMCLRPRQSFQLWQEIVRLKSQPWQAEEIKAALELQKAIVNTVLRQEIHQRQRIQERLALAQQVGKIGTFEWHVPSDQVTWSPELEVLYGVNPGDFGSTYDGWLQTLHAEDRNRVEQELQQTLQTGDGLNTTFRLQPGDPAPRWIAAKSNLFYDASGQPTRMIGVHIDITENKRLEAQFLRAQRLESLGTLASGIAHDLNNIFTPILAAAKLLPLKLPHLDAQVQQLLTMLDTSAQRGADLVQQILSFTRGVEGKRAVLQVPAVLMELFRILRQTLPKSIAMDTQIAADLWNVFGDATQIHQIFMNLCVNARDAMPEGGILQITAENRQIDAPYARMHLDAQVGAYVMVRVADTGTGIKPEVLNRIFDPFFTTKAVGQGTGLGLSAVLGIVKSHGGFIDVQSSPGQGSQFSIFLPASEAVPAQAEPDLELLMGHQELILVVDDEAAICEIIKATLETYNYRVLTASDGVEAIARLAEYKQEIRAVLMDIMMPTMDGLATLPLMRRLSPAVYGVAMSGLNSSETVAQTQRLGFQAFLPKPFITQTLLDILHKGLVGPVK